jgi:hypothetical protein
MTPIVALFVVAVVIVAAIAIALVLVTGGEGPGDDGMSSSWRADHLRNRRED